MQVAGLPSSFSKREYAITSHPVIWAAYKIKQATYTISLEVIKILAATLFLELLAQPFLKHASYSTRWSDSSASIIVRASFLEEIIFRGVILCSILLVQKCVNCFLIKDRLTEKDKTIQQVFRIQISALLFATAHLFNPLDKITLAMQFINTYFFGVCVGYLTEKYQTLSFGILLHGLNNATVLAYDFYPKYQPVWLSVILIQNIALSIFAFWYHNPLWKISDKT